MADLRLVHPKRDWTKGRGPTDTGGNPPGGDDLERRVEALEKISTESRERLIRIEEKLGALEKHGATKAEIEAVCTKIEGMSSKIEAMGRTMIQWSIGTAVVLAGIAFTAARFIPGG